MFQYWENCRWADPNDREDLEKITFDLDRAHALHAKLRGCTVERLCEVLTHLYDSRQTEGSSDVEDESIPSSNLSNKSVVKSSNNCMPSFMGTKMKDCACLYAGHENFVQVLIPYQHG